MTCRTAKYQAFSIQSGSFRWQPPQDPPRVANEPGADPASRSSGARIFVWPMRCATFSATRPITHGRIVTIGQLLLFSTETGDAWLLDPADRLAARLARDGES